MRKLAWFAASCSAAVFLAVYVLPEGALVPLGAVCALAALAELALRGDRRRRVLLAGFGLAAGLLWTAAYGALFQAPARALAGYEGPVEVTVADWPQATAYGSSVLVRLHPVEGWPVRTLLYLDAPAPDLRPGDGLTVQARLRAADTIAGESTDYYYAKGVRLIAYGEGEGETVRPGRPPLWTWPAYVSKALKGAVAAAFPEEAAPLVTALLTGDRSGLSDGDYAALRRSGLAHVIAVSGLHVSFLAGLAAALLGARRRRTAVCTIALLLCFAAVVGNTPSVLRAVFMQSMLLLAPLLGREEDKPTSLCAVLMLLLLQNPYAAASVSLQLSFAAVAGIYLFSGPLTERWTARLPARPKGFWAKTGCLAARFVLSSLAVSLGAIAFTTPLTAWHFQSVSLAGPLANLLCLWAVSLAFLGGLAAA
ncbi:ComEC/Rec2 family competence protein, partial [Flavonifractor plautii]